MTLIIGQHDFPLIWFSKYRWFLATLSASAHFLQSQSHLRGKQWPASLQHVPFWINSIGSSRSASASWAYFGPLKIGVSKLLAYQFLRGWLSKFVKTSRKLKLSVKASISRTFGGLYAYGNSILSIFKFSFFTPRSIIFPQNQRKNWQLSLIGLYRQLNSRNFVRYDWSIKNFLPKNDFF